MVTLEQKAWMFCDEPNCTKAERVVLVLTGTGGFVFKPVMKGLGWQVRIGNVDGPFITRCPEHKTTVEPVAPIIQGANP